MRRDDEVKYRAMESRDARFDGRFFVCVKTTGVYCRPICSARTPKRDNVTFAPTAAAAESAGFRPCRRCRPEAAPGTPAWVGTPAVVSRALRLVSAGFLDDHDVPALAERVGIGERQLRRLVHEHLGAPVLRVALARRVHFARRLIDETDLPMTEIAFAAGFGSVRSFNDGLRRTFGRTPTELRCRRGNGERRLSSGIRLRLAYRPPLGWGELLRFLAPRVTSGVESIEEGVYRRTIEIAGQSGLISVRALDDGRHVELSVDSSAGTGLLEIVERVRDVFDLNADPHAILSHLRRESHLRTVLGGTKCVRVPGAWDGFELTVRAILGQQVTVRGATTLTGRLAARFGRPLPGGSAGLDRLFPRPEDLAGAAVESIGLPGRRAESLRSISRAVRDDPALLDPARDAGETMQRLRALPGIGDWTAQYVAMRALREPDAFPAGDLGLRKLLGGGAPLGEKELARRAEPWRPWRSYAAMAIWGSHSA